MNPVRKVTPLRSWILLGCLSAGFSLAPIGFGQIAPIDETKPDVPRAAGELRPLVNPIEFGGPNAVRDRAVRERLKEADTAYGANKIAEAEKILRGAVAEFPDSAAVKVSLGRFAYSQNRKTEAVDWYKKALAQQESAYMYVDLGTIYAEAFNQPIEALECFHKATEKDPDNGGAHYATGQILSRMGQTEEARKEFAKATKLEPKQALGWVALGRVNLQLHQVDAAVEAYRNALALGPNTPVSLELAEIYALRGGDDAALQVYNSLLEREPDNPLILSKVGLFFHGRNQPKRAAEYYDRALKVKADLPVVLNNRAALYLKSPDIEKGIPLAERAVKLEPKNPNFLDTWGELLFRTGKFADAESVLAKAVAMAPDAPSIRYHLALTQNDQRKRAEAAASLRLALASKAPFPERDEATSLLGKLVAQFDVGS